MSDSSQNISDPSVSPAERYERGLALKQAGLHKAAIDQFEMAAVEAALALMAYAQSDFAISWLVAMKRLFRPFKRR